jgi:sulfur-oxidizing protein SoxY
MDPAIHSLAHGMRRAFLRKFAVCCASLLAAGWLYPVRLLAAQWNKPAFDSKQLDEVLKIVGATSAIESSQIELKAPKIAENGAIVPVEVTSKIPKTQSIYIIAEKNPQPLVAIFDILPGLAPFVSTRIKMGESAKVRVLIKAAGKFYVTTQEIKVNIGGCGD